MAEAPLPPGLSLAKPESAPDSDLPAGLSPTKGGQTGEAGGALSAFGGGVAHGLGNIVWGAGQLGTHLLPGSYEGSLAQRMDKAAAERETSYQQDPTRTAHPFAAGVGQIGGEIAGTLPLDLIPGAGPAALAARVGRYGRGVIKGAEIGAIMPETGGEGRYGSEKLGDVALGAAGGAAGEAIAGRLGAVVSPRLPRQAQMLAQEGVRLTPGLTTSPTRMAGRAGRRIEETLKSFFPLGEAIRSGQQTSVQDFNTASINRVLRQVGAQELSRGSYGRDAIRTMQTAVSDAYDRVLTPLTWQADQDFFRNVGFQYLGGGGGIRILQGQNMLNPVNRLTTPAMQREFMGIFRERVLNRIDPRTGTMTGQQLKEVESELGQLASTFRASGDGRQRLLGDSIRDLQEEIRDSLERQNPASAAELRNANTAYAMAQRINQASSSRGAVTGAEQGVFRATDLLNAVRAQDRTRMKAAFSRGDALMQDWAEAAQEILGGRMPDSGTAERLLSLHGIGRLAFGGAGHGLGAAAAGWVPVAAASLAAAVPYTRPVMGAMTRYMASPSGWRSGLRQPIADISSRIGDPALAAIMTGNPDLGSMLE